MKFGSPRRSVVFVGGETPMGERIAMLEALYPELKEDMQDIKSRMDRMCAKIDDFLTKAATQEAVREVRAEVEKVKREMQEKADKNEVRQIRERMLMWMGGGAVLLVLATWYGPKLLGLVAK